MTRQRARQRSTRGALALELTASVTPIRSEPAAPDLADRLILAVATADDVTSALEHVVAMLRRAGGADGAEWWQPDAGGSAMRLMAAEGTGRGPRKAFSLGPLGTLVVVGEQPVPALAAALPQLVTILRRHWTGERLADHSGRLARRIEALEDFAALVAHELKAPLQEALLGGDPETNVARALELVDSLLECTRAEAAPDGGASGVQCLDDALQDLGTVGARVLADLPHRLPISPTALRLVLRNLVANAVAAGSRTIRVRSTASAGRWSLTVDDDGVGLDDTSGYAGGCGLGISLCRRLAERLGGALELEPRPRGGTRATLLIARAEL